MLPAEQLGPRKLGFAFGPEIAQHRDEIVHLIQMHEKKEKSQKPLLRIMDIDQKRDGIEVTTTECEIATFCLEHGFSLLHSSPGYEPFETYLGLKGVK